MRDVWDVIKTKQKSLMVDSRCSADSMEASLRTAAETVREFDIIPFINKCE